jgi:hypothetical protein
LVAATALGDEELLPLRDVAPLGNPRLPGPAAAGSERRDPQQEQSRGEKAQCYAGGWLEAPTFESASSRVG